MPLVLPTIDQIDAYLDSVEQIVVSSLSAATPDLGQVSEAINRLWQDVLRHSPQAVPATLKGLGAFEVPPPPPPPPPPRGLWENTADWVADHPWTVAGLGIGVVGAGLLVGYASPRFHRRTRVGARRHVAPASTERRQVIVVLGGDSPLGLPLILDLEKKGYIVVTSVSTPESVDEIESKCHGYVRALVLDPSEPEMIPFFLRSLASTMSRRFPITAVGDPHAPPTTHIYVHSVVSLLTLPSPSLAPAPAPLEHLNLRSTYSEYLQATHIVPLQVLQALLPLLRASVAGRGKRAPSTRGREYHIKTVRWGVFWELKSTQDVQRIQGMRGRENSEDGWPGGLGARRVGLGRVQYSIYQNMILFTTLRADWSPSPKVQLEDGRADLNEAGLWGKRPHSLLSSRHHPRPAVCPASTSPSTSLASRCSSSNPKQRKRPGAFLRTDKNATTTRSAECWASQPAGISDPFLLTGRPQHCVPSPGNGLRRAQ